MNRQILITLILFLALGCAGRMDAPATEETRVTPEGATFHFVVAPWQAFTPIAVKCSELERAFDVTVTDVVVSPEDAREFVHSLNFLSQWEDPPSYVDTRIRLLINSPDAGDVEVCFGRTGVEYNGHLYLMEDDVLQHIGKYVPEVLE